MPDKRSLGARVNARLARWETVLTMVFVVDLLEDKVLFKAQQIPAWGRVLVKMALVVGIFGLLLTFVNRRIDRSLAVTRSAGEKLVVPRILIHAVLFGALFTGIHWLKIGRLPWG